MIHRFNGTDLANFLNKKKSTRHMARKIIRLRDLASISEDIGHASAAIDELAATFPNEYDGTFSLALDAKTSVLHGALAQRAIVLYARATDTNSDSRGKFDVKNHYDNDQKDWHVQIIKVRNSAIAHYGPGNHDGRPWAIDNIYFDFSVFENKLWIRPEATHYNYRGDIIRMLVDLLPFAKAAIMTEYDKAEASLHGDMQTDQLAFEEALSACGTIPIVKRDEANFTPVPFAK